MPDYAIAAYTLRVRNRGVSAKVQDHLELDNFDGSGSDLLQFIYAFLNSVTTQPINDKVNEKYLKVVKVTPHGRLVRASIDAGSFGYRSRLYDVEEDRESYRRRISDAELLRLRNLFACPHGSQVGLFLTERVGKQGLKRSLVEALKRTFRHHHPEYILDVNPLAPEDAVRQSVQDGEVKGVRLVRYGIPRDLEARYELGEHVKEKGTLELVFRPSRGASFRKRKLLDLLENDVGGLLEFGDVQFEDVKVDVKVGTQKRTVTFSDGKTRVTYLLPDDVDADDSGRPYDAGFYSYAMEVATELALEIGIDENVLAGEDFRWTPAMTQRTVELVIDED